ncbi:MAG: hypothetical protein RL685_866 [Pseudomonadota bacterium]|jgi:hypothetical protein
MASELRQATISDDVDAGAEAAVRRGQEQDGARDLVGAADATERDALSEVVLQRVGG